MENILNDKLIKLKFAFRDALQEFVEGLKNAEKLLSTLKPNSRFLKGVSKQIKDHKVFRKEVVSL